MSKRNARASAMSGAWTVGALRSAIQSARGQRALSIVNPGIPHARALDIYEAALASMGDDERPSPTILDAYTGRQKPGKMALIITNILRDCGNPPTPTGRAEG